MLKIYIHKLNNSAYLSIPLLCLKKFTVNLGLVLFKHLLHLQTLSQPPLITVSQQHCPLQADFDAPVVFVGVLAGEGGGGGCLRRV